MTKELTNKEKQEYEDTENKEEKGAIGGEDYPIMEEKCRCNEGIKTGTEFDCSCPVHKNEGED